MNVLVVQLVIEIDFTDTSQILRKCEETAAKYKRHTATLLAIYNKIHSNIVNKRIEFVIERE